MGVGQNDQTSAGRHRRAGPDEGGHGQGQNGPQGGAAGDWCRMCADPGFGTAVWAGASVVHVQIPHQRAAINRRWVTSVGCWSTWPRPVVLKA
ncbi:hypothetical protein DVDV_1121 [Desulfovibrio sp. DV]|nr:hypothetical protein DVDV_1121 [Desulfovibrio sp. DV]